MKTTMNTNNRFFILITIFFSIVITSMTSCTTTQRSLEDKCILKDPRYSQFVADHQLECDIEEFLNENK